MVVLTFALDYATTNQALLDTVLRAGIEALGVKDVANMAIAYSEGSVVAAITADVDAAFKIKRAIGSLTRAVMQGVSTTTTTTTVETSTTTTTTTLEFILATKPGTRAFTGKEFTVPTPGTRFAAGTTYKIAPLAVDASATKVTGGSLADVTYSLRGGDSVASGALTVDPATGVVTVNADPSPACDHRNGRGCMQRMDTVLVATDAAGASDTLLIHQHSATELN